MARLPKLTEMLQESPIFTDPSHEDFLPLNVQERTLRLAEVFQESIANMYLDPEELATETPYTNANYWEEFLNLEPVILYVGVRTKNQSSVNARKALKSLEMAARKGDVSAIKYQNEIAGILQNQSNNKIIVLHMIPRPNIAPQPNPAITPTKEDDDE